MSALSADLLPHIYGSCKLAPISIGASILDEFWLTMMHVSLLCGVYRLDSRLQMLRQQKFPLLTWKQLHGMLFISYQ